MIKINVTTLEQFRYMLHTEESNEAIKNSLIQRVQTIEMAKGTVLHEILEKGVVDALREDNIKHILSRYNDGIAMKIKIWIQELLYMNLADIFKTKESLGEAVAYEVKDTLVLSSKGETIHLVGKCDAMNHEGLHEFKFTSTTFGDLYPRYANSLQWQIYTDLFEQERFKYHIFVMNQNKTVVLEQMNFVFSGRAKSANYMEYIDLFVDFINNNGIRNEFEIHS